MGSCSSKPNDQLRNDSLNSSSLHPVSPNLLSPATVEKNQSVHVNRTLFKGFDKDDERTNLDEHISSKTSDFHKSEICKLKRQHSVEIQQLIESHESAIHKLKQEYETDIRLLQERLHIVQHRLAETTNRLQQIHQQTTEQRLADEEFLATARAVIKELQQEKKDLQESHNAENRRLLIQIDQLQDSAVKLTERVGSVIEQQQTLTNNSSSANNNIASANNTPNLNDGSVTKENGKLHNSSSCPNDLSKQILVFDNPNYRSPMKTSTMRLKSSPDREPIFIQSASSSVTNSPRNRAATVRSNEKLHISNLDSETMDFESYITQLKKEKKRDEELKKKRLQFEGLFEQRNSAPVSPNSHDPQINKQSTTEKELAAKHAEIEELQRALNAVNSSVPRATSRKHDDRYLTSQELQKKQQRLMDARNEAELLAAKLRKEKLASYVANSQIST